MVFVDGKLEDTSSGLPRGDRLRAFLDRWGFTDDDFNPWSNPKRWNPGPIRDRIDNASLGGSLENGSASRAEER